MRNVFIGLTLAMVGCADGKWDGRLIDSFRGTFAGEFDPATLKHNITGEAALLVDLYRCGRDQCADVTFEGSLSSATTELDGPETHTIRGVTIDYPDVWSEFQVDGYDVRGEGTFLDDDRRVWFEMFIDIALLGFVNVGEITLDLVGEDEG